MRSEVPRKGRMGKVPRGEEWEKPPERGEIDETPRGEEWERSTSVKGEEYEK